MAVLCKQRFLGALLAVGLSFGALPAHGSMSIGFGFSTGNVGVGFTTYAPLSIFDYAYTSSRTVRFVDTQASSIVHRQHSRKMYIQPTGSAGQLRYSPRTYRKSSPPGYSGYERSRSYNNRGYPPGHSMRDYPPDHARRGYGGYYSGRYPKNRTPQPSPRETPAYFGPRYNRHFGSPGYSRPARPSVPYPSSPPPRGYRPSYRDSPRFSGSFVIIP